MVSYVEQLEKRELLVKHLIVVHSQAIDCFAQGVRVVQDLPSSACAAVVVVQPVEANLGFAGFESTHVSYDASPAFYWLLVPLFPVLSSHVIEPVAVVAAAVFVAVAAVVVAVQRSALVVEDVLRGLVLSSRGGFL